MKAALVSGQTVLQQMALPSLPQPQRAVWQVKRGTTVPPLTDKAGFLWGPRASP